MKRIINFFIAVFFLCSSAYGQVTIEAYDKAVNYVNCKAVELVLSGRQKEVLEAFKSNCDCAASPEYNKIKAFIPGIETKTMKLAFDIDAIKKEYTTKLSQEQVVRLLSGDIFNNQKYPGLVAFAEKRKGQVGYTNFIKDLQTELPKILSPAVSPGSRVVPDSLRNNTQGLEQPVKIPENNREAYPANRNIVDNTTFQVIVFIVLGLIIAGIILLFKEVKRIAYKVNKKEVPDFYKSYVMEKVAGELYGSGNSKSKFLVRLNQDLEEIRSEIINLRKQAGPSKFWETAPVNQDFEKKREVNGFTEQLYLSVPNPDGSFNESSAQPFYKEGASIYRLTKVSSNKAEFQIDDRDASMQLALQSPEKIIDPVCDAINAFNSEPMKIITRKPGEAELVGGKWKVNRKAKILYGG